MTGNDFLDFLKGVAVAGGTAYASREERKSQAEQARITSAAATQQQQLTQQRALASIEAGTQNTRALMYTVGGLVLIFVLMKKGIL